jgi:6-phosphogluconolactonase
MSDVRVYSDSSAMAHAAAIFFAEEAAGAIAARGRFSVALAGGSTPRATYKLLASGEYAGRADWSRVHVFWGDERCVPPDHPDSNYAMAADALLSRVPIPERNIHPMRTDLAPEAAAEDYAAELRRALCDTEECLPRFDMVLLGIGADGHTASLFPEEGLASHEGRLVVATAGKRGGHRRLTLTLEVINNAARVAFLVSGVEKAAVLARILAGVGPTPPAGLVSPGEGRLVWFVDRSALPAGAPTSTTGPI